MGTEKQYELIPSEGLCDVNVFLFLTWTKISFEVLMILIILTNPALKYVLPCRAVTFHWKLKLEQNLKTWGGKKDKLFSGIS